MGNELCLIGRINGRPNTGRLAIEGNRPKSTFEILVDRGEMRRAVVLAKSRADGKEIARLEFEHFEDWKGLRLKEELCGAVWPIEAGSSSTTSIYVPTLVALAIEHLRPGLSSDQTLIFGPFGLENTRDFVRIFGSRLDQLDQRWSEYVSDRREFVAAFPRLDGPQYTQAETKLVAYLPAKTGAQFKCWTERTEILCRLHGTDNPVAVVLDLLRDNQVQEAVQMIIDQNLAKGFRQDSHVYLPDEAETPLDREFAPFTGESTREKRLIVLKEDGLRVRLLRLDRGENYIIDVS